jgi:hypothetical protein
MLSFKLQHVIWYTLTNLLHLLDKSQNESSKFLQNAGNNLQCCVRTQTSTISAHSYNYNLLEYDTFQPGKSLSTLCRNALSAV